MQVRFFGGDISPAYPFRILHILIGSKFLCGTMGCTRGCAIYSDHDEQNCVMYSVHPVSVHTLMSEESRQPCRSLWMYTISSIYPFRLIECATKRYEGRWLPRTDEEC